MAQQAAGGQVHLDRGLVPALQSAQPVDQLAQGKGGLPQLGEIEGPGDGDHIVGKIIDPALGVVRRVASAFGADALELGQLFVHGGQTGGLGKLQVLCGPVHGLGDADAARVTHDFGEPVLPGNEGCARHAASPSPISSTGLLGTAAGALAASIGSLCRRPFPLGGPMSWNRRSGPT